MTQPANAHGDGGRTRPSAGTAEADADLKAATSPPNPNVNRQDLSAVESRGAVGLLAEDVGVTDVPG